MMETVIVQQDETINKMTRTKTNIIVVDNGFVFLGELQFYDGFTTVLNCKNIRSYGTTDGLGQIALKGVQEETKLDDFGIITIPNDKVIFTIDCTHESFN